MTRAEVEAHINEWIDEVWNNKDLNAVDTLVTPNFVSNHAPVTGAGPGPYKVFLAKMFATLPNAQSQVEDILVDGDKAVVRWTLNGTIDATNELEGTTAHGAGQGDPVTFSGVTVFRLENGLTAETWKYGLMPEMLA